jgi:hypothetical protein
LTYGRAGWWLFFGCVVTDEHVVPVSSLEDVSTFTAYENVVA